MEDWERAPEEVLRLVTDLRANGFTVHSSRVRNVVQQVYELRDGSATVAVRISVDRGPWTIELGRAGTDDLFGPDLWAAHLDGRPIGTDMSLSEMADFVRHRTADVVQAARRDPQLAGRLRRTREAWVRAQLGWPPAID